jgi:hypothetical protein
MNNDMIGNALMKSNQSKLPEKSSASESPYRAPVESEADLHQKYPNGELPNGIRVAQTQVLMDINGVHPVTDDHKEMFDYKNRHKERNGY